MKTLTLHFWKKGTAVVLFLLAMSSMAVAQSDRAASIDLDAKVLSIDENIPFGHNYQLNIADCKFADKVSAEEFFKGMSTDLVSYEVHFDKQQVDIILSVRQQPRWGAAEWNKYLKSLESK